MESGNRHEGRRDQEGGGGEAPRPLVSVVIPCHDYARFLPGCLASLLAQELDPKSLEVIFVDDASSDGSLELARELLAAAPLGSWRALAVPRAGRPGPVRNAGLALARGRFLLTLDPDDELLPCFLPRCLEALEAGADVAYTDYFVQEGDGVSLMRLRGYHRLILASQNMLSPTALFRRRFWDAGARFRRGTAYEDWDFWVQLALRRARFAHVAEPAYLYRVHGDNFSRAARAEDSLAKARLVLGNADFFPAWTVAWARRVLRGEPGADALGRGLIPILPEHAGARLAG